MSSDILIIIFIILYIAGGTYYRYKVVKARFELGYYVVLIFSSYFAAQGTVLLLGGLDFIFNKSLWLDYSVGNMTPIIFIGSFGSLVAGGVLFFIFLRNRGNLMTLIKRRGDKRSKKE